jgi:hypothetical protein
VDEILTGLSIEMIETVFVDWMNRLQLMIDGNGDYVSSNTTSELLNGIRQWQACSDKALMNTLYNLHLTEHL